MFDGNFRTTVDKATAPIGQGLARAGVSPDAITLVGVAMAGACGFAIAVGQFPLAVLLLALTGLPDALDGAVAKAKGSAGPRGAYFDSVSDRLSDALLFIGCAWYLGGTDSPRLAMLPFALYVAASLVSYQRAKAESLGFEAKGGLMERAERFLALGFGLLFSPLFTITLWVMLALTVITALTRFRKVWLQASGLEVAPPRIDAWRQRADANRRRRRASRTSTGTAGRTNARRRQRP